MSLLPRRTLPVLMYHRIGSQPVGDPDLWISPEVFERQLGWLHDHGFRSLGLDEAFAGLTAAAPPRRTVLLTIDDGFGDDLARAEKLLLGAGAQATVFVPAGLLGRQVELRHPSGVRALTSPGTLVDREGLGRWLAAGFDLGSHGLKHVDLTTADPETLEEETRGSKTRLEELLDRPVRDFCYPFAHHDERVRRAVAGAGYRAAYAGEPPFHDRLAVPRMMVYPRDDLARFRRKVSGYYYWISRMHQKLRRFVRD